MEAEISKQANTRRILEEIAQGDVGDDILTPLMMENAFDVEKCVEVLLDIINEGRQQKTLSQSVHRLHEERQYFEECRKQADAQTRIAEELRRKDEVSKRLAEVEEENRRQLAQMRRDMEQEWLRRLEDQQKEVLEKQKAMEEQREKLMREQLQKVGQARDAQFVGQVEGLLKQRILEQQKKEAEEIRGAVTAPALAASAPAPAATAAATTPSSSGPTIELTAPESAEVGSTITVYWEYKNGRPSLSDWIGYYKKSRPIDSNQYYAYQKTGGSEKGKLEFVVPSKLGICEVRMFQNNSYRIAARSGPIRVGNEVTVTAALKGDTLVCAVTYKDKARQHSTWDWLGVYEEGESDNKAYLVSAYVTSDCVEISRPPRRPGRYVVKYFQSGSGYSELGQSSAFEVADRDELSVPNRVERGAFADISWRILSVDPETKDVIRLFRVSEGSLNPLLCLGSQPTHCNQSEGKMKFLISSGVTPGNYELAFFSAKSGKPVKRSIPFEVIDPAK